VTTIQTHLLAPTSTELVARSRAHAQAIEVELARRQPPPAVYLPLEAPGRYKGARGGRGSGKSHYFAKKVIDRHVARETRTVCVREHQVTLEQSVKRLLEDKIKLFNLGNKFRVMDNRIEDVNGGIIIFQGMKDYTAESIKSLEGYHIAWVEEAQSLSQRSLELLRPTIREKDSEIWFSWNPSQPTDPVDAFLCSGSLPPGAIVVKSTWADNPFFPDVLRQEMEWDRSRDIETYDHVWGGDYEKHAEARVFRNWREEEFETPDDVTHYFGGDWGFSADPSVLVRCHVIGRQLRVDWEAWEIGCPIDRLPELFAAVPGSKDWPSIADCARPETIDYLQRHGYPKMEPAKKGPDSVKEGIIFLQGYDIVVHPRCVQTLKELRRYSYKVDRLTGIVTPTLQDKDNHVIDSLRYAVERLRKPPEPEFLNW